MKLKKTPFTIYLITQFILFIGFLLFPLFSVENFFFFSQNKNIINILMALLKNNEIFLFFVLFIGTVLIVKIIKLTTGLRVPEDEEIGEGLDFGSHGESSYNL